LAIKLLPEQLPSRQLTESFHTRDRLQELI